jgi:hypothetical protein
MIEGPVFKRTVFVSKKPCEITVYRTSKTVWEAVGDHNGETYRVKRSSLAAAEKAWAEAAEYHYHRN